MTKAGIYPMKNWLPDGWVKGMILFILPVFFAARGGEMPDSTAAAGLPATAPATGNAGGLFLWGRSPAVVSPHPAPAPFLSAIAALDTVPLPPPISDEYYPRLDDGTPWKRSTRIIPPRLGVIIAGFAIGDAIGFAKIADLQYNTETSSFHFHEWRWDSREYQQMDKIGHFVEAYFMSHLASRIYRWSGFSAKKSIWWGAGTGLLWMTQIEVTDGFFKNWGFSYLDYTMNVLGCGYAVLQQYYPEQLKAYRFKVSFWPSDAYRNDLYSTVSKSILDDYEGFTWWFAVNVHDALPGKWQRNYPGWLKPWGVAVGQSAKGIAQDVFGGYREIFIALDFDVTKIPTGDSQFLKFVKDIVNFVHLPMPAVRITPDAVVYGFYF